MRKVGDIPELKERKGCREYLMRKVGAIVDSREKRRPEKDLINNARDLMKNAKI